MDTEKTGLTRYSEAQLKLMSAIRLAIRQNRMGLTLADQSEAIEWVLRDMHFQARVIG